MSQTPVIWHMTSDKIIFGWLRIVGIFCIGATICTHQKFQCLPYDFYKHTFLFSGLYKDTIDPLDHPGNLKLWWGNALGVWNDINRGLWVQKWPKAMHCIVRWVCLIHGRVLRVQGSKQWGMQSASYSIQWPEKRIKGHWLEFIAAVRCIIFQWSIAVKCSAVKWRAFETFPSIVQDV